MKKQTYSLTPEQLAFFNANQEKLSQWLVRTHKFYHHSMDSSDCKQLARIAVWKAVSTLDSSRSKVTTWALLFYRNMLRRTSLVGKFDHLPKSSMESVYMKHVLDTCPALAVEDSPAVSAAYAKEIVQSFAPHALQYLTKPKKHKTEFGEDDQRGRPVTEKSARKHVWLLEQHYFEGRTDRDIADELHVTHQAVENSRNKAVAALKRYCQDVGL